MKLITVQLPYDHNLFNYGDVHYGNSLSSATGWNELVNMLHSEYDGCSNNFAAEGGDMIEAILIDDKRADAQKLLEPFILAQIRTAKARRQRIKKLMLYLMEGNHEGALWKLGDIAADIAKDLGVRYGTWTTKLTVKDKKGNLMYKLYDTHGRKLITSTADDPLRREVNSQLILKRHLKFMAGDCALMIKHHAHRLLVTKPTSELYLVDDGRKIIPRYTGPSQTGEFIHPDARYYGCAGSFLKLFEDGKTSYAERAEYTPIDLGFLITKVRDGKIVDVVKHYIRQ